MVRKSTRKLSEYNLFIQKECAKLKEQGIRISGRGKLLTYLSKIWQKKKEIVSVKTEVDDERPLKKLKIENDNDVDDLTSMISNVSINTDIEDLTFMILDVKL